MRRLLFSFVMMLFLVTGFQAVDEAQALEAPDVVIEQIADQPEIGAIMVHYVEYGVPADIKSEVVLSGDPPATNRMAIPVSEKRVNYTYTVKKLKPDRVSCLYRHGYTQLE